MIVIIPNTLLISRCIFNVSHLSWLFDIAEDGNTFQHAYVHYLLRLLEMLYAYLTLQRGGI
jgi:hypothetical protein